MYMYIHIHIHTYNTLCVVLGVCFGKRKEVWQSAVMAYFTLAWLYGCGKLIVLAWATHRVGPWRALGFRAVRCPCCEHLTVGKLISPPHLCHEFAPAAGRKP